MSDTEQQRNLPPPDALLLIGASGFGRELLWVCQRQGLTVAGFCDDASDKQEGCFAGLPLLGAIEQVAARGGGRRFFHVAVGDNRARQQLVSRALACGWSPVAVVDPSAVVAPDAAIEAGAYVGIGSIVSCRSQLGCGVIVNHHVTVGHDCQVAPFAQLCPGVRVSGGCRIGEGALVGSNAIVLPNKSLGAWSVLGAGTVAVRDLEDGAQVARIR